MSEIIPGIEAVPPPTPRESAVVAVLRRGPEGWEVLLGLRSGKSSFFPRNWALPGGSLEAEDDPDAPGAHARCAARELFEETGIAIGAEKLVSVGVKTTPPFHPIRYRTEFFVTPAPPGLTLPANAPSPDENEDLRFWLAAEALEAWDRGEIHFPPPLPPLLRAFARERAARFDQLPRLLAVVSEFEERTPRNEFLPWVWMLPVEAGTLPPATHTNVWIAGGKRVVVVDPGAASRADVERLLEVVARRLRIGAEPEAILLTHQHRDHVAAAAELAARLRVPVRCHAATAAALSARGFEGPLRGDLEDGTRLDLGGTTIVAHHTPGHAPGHLIFEIPERRAALCGDLLSGFSSIVIDPGDGGDMGQYVASLRRAQELEIDLYFPAHGPPLGRQALAAALAHRAEREGKVQAALTVLPRSVEEIVVEAYADTPGAHPELARRQALAHLERLVRLGLAASGPAGAFRLPPPPQPSEDELVSDEDEPPIASPG